MELLVAILLAIGSLTSQGAYNDEYINTHQTDIAKAQSIIDNNQYQERDGGVVVDPGVGL